MIAKSKSLDDTRATPYPKMPPSEAVYTYGVSQYGVQPSGVWTSHWYPPSASLKGRGELPAHS
jgi:hypothetical protein